MIIVKLLGGLGNQLFQFALGRHLAIRNKTELKFDITDLLDHRPKGNFTLRHLSMDAFDVSFERATDKDLNKFHLKPQNFFQFHLGKFLRKINKHQIYQEKGSFYDPEILKAGKRSYIDGYWQSEKYFKEIEPIIRNDLQLKKPLPSAALKQLDHISNENAVSLHIRRGDYVTNILAKQLLGTLSLDYYQTSIQWIAQKVRDPYFFIFSDDMDWVKKNLDLNYPFKIIEGNPEYVDLYLMSKCKHNIIANSSFSWWGAWLNANPEKIVICPKNWYADTTYKSPDLKPQAWIQL